MPPIFANADTSANRTAPTNRQIILASRPSGAPTAANFRLEKAVVPGLEPGQILLRTLYLSLDPYMRGRMSDAPSYAAPVAVGSPMGGATVSRVQDSRNPAYVAGDLVLANGGWQDYCVSDGKGLVRISAGTAQPSLYLGVLGMPGFTGYMGLLEIGQPQAGETVVVAAASGAVGSVVGQIAKLRGCRAVGVAGGEKKCQAVVQDLGFDVCIDRHSSQFAEQLAAACPSGIDVYFESVGGAVLDAVLPLLNPRARVPLCGMVSHYNDTAPPAGPDRMGLLLRTLLTKRIKMQGFIIFEDYGSRYSEFFTQMQAWVHDGKINFREDMVSGLENAAQAFIGMLEGKNFGKLVVQVAPA